MKESPGASFQLHCSPSSTGVAPLHDGDNSFDAFVRYRASIAEKGLTIGSEYEPSTVAGPHDEPVTHIDTDVSNKHVYTAITDVDNSGGHWTGVFYGELFGTWHTPYDAYLSVSWLHAPTNPLVHNEEFDVSLNQLKNMIKGQPKEVYVPLTATDSYDSFTATATMTAHVYPQSYMPTDTSNVIVYSDWYDASPTITLHSYSSPSPVNITNTAASSVTTSVTLGFSLDLSAKFLEIYTAALKPSVSWNWGETSTITGSVTSGYTPSQMPPSGVTWTWKIIRRIKWREVHGCALRYGLHGYEGLDDYAWVGFVSPSKEQAALSDYEQDERYTGEGAPVK